MDPAQLPLRNVHLPDAIGWWPLAPGWWILSGLMVLLIALIAGWRYRMKKYAAKKQALKEFKKLRHAQNLSEKQRIISLSKLLRQASISIFPRDHVAGLTGHEWLDFLDRSLHDGRFSKGVGQSLIEAPYKPEHELDSAALFKLCEEWFNALPQKQK